MHPARPARVCMVCNVRRLGLSPDALIHVLPKAGALLRRLRIRSGLLRGPRRQPAFADERRLCVFFLHGEVPQSTPSCGCKVDLSSRADATQLSAGSATPHGRWGFSNLIAAAVNLLPQVQPGLQRIRSHDHAVIREVDDLVLGGVVAWPCRPAAAIRIAGFRKRHPI